MAARARLADAVIALRGRLGVTQEELAARAEGITAKTIQRIEQKRIKPRATTFTALDAACGWVEGSARALYEHGLEPVPRGVPKSASAGGRPVSAGDRPAGLLNEWTDDEVARVRAMTPQQLVDEGGVIGKFSGPEAQMRYLHDVTILTTEVRADGGRTP
jgi:DNA-binding XRE family transcriptional regulator